MAGLRLTWRERLGLLGAKVLDGVDQADPDNAELVDLAEAMVRAARPRPTIGVPAEQQHRNTIDQVYAEVHADRLAGDLFRYVAKPDRLEVIRAEVIGDLVGGTT